MTGGLFPGSPIVNHGHNENIGWSFTSNSPDLIDVYELQMNPLNENQYLFDGSWKNLSIEEIKLKIKIFGPIKWTVKRKVYKSIHGPVLKQEHGTYAIRYSGINEMKTLEQFYRMNKSQNIEQFKKAMNMQALPMYNTGYADKNGNIFYVYNAMIPKRDSSYNWSGILPGNTSNTLWYEYIDFKDLPQVTNPKGGFFQNCNANPFLATGFPDDIKSKGINNSAGIETHQTNRSLRAIRLYGGDEKISKSEFYNYKFDNEYEKTSVMAYAINTYIEDVKTDDLELLAAIPTIVYGFFALTVVTPFLKQFIDIESFNSLSAGLVMGIMIIPYISSISEDALYSVPKSLREAAYGMGSTRLQTAFKVTIPAATSGIIVSIILAISRAIGETMIVAIAAGQKPTLTLDPTETIATITSFIVQVLSLIHI